MKIARLFLLVVAVAASSATATADETFPGACEREAVALTKATDLLDGKGPAASSVGVLAAGRFIYRCETSDALVRVVYPRLGEPVDCTFRTAEMACPTGWLHRPLEVETFG